MPFFEFLPSIAGGVLGAAQAISGASNLQKDKAELARLTPAFYKIQDEYYGNRNQAAVQSQSGFTQAAKDYYTDTMSRGFSSGLGTLLSAGGSANDIATLFDTYSQGMHRLAADDSERQLKNIQYYQQAAKDLAGQKTMQWAINEYQPYQNKLKELTQRIAADKNNIWGGLQSIVGAGQAAVTVSQNDDLIKGLISNLGGTKDGKTATPVPNFSGDPFLKSTIPMFESDVTDRPVEQNSTDSNEQLAQLLKNIQGLFNRKT
ncbi:MAG: hypothetical protein KDC56_05565 [Flavobacteriaceae bacterium]|nr:hypothetical protein [Flavobacteriaceae bacterium]